MALQRLAAELLAAHGCAVTVPEAEALWRVVHARLPPPDRPVVRPPPAPLPPLAAAAAAAADPARSRAEKQKRLRELWRGLRR